VALPTLPDPAALVTLGVDTHAGSHVAAALDQAGRPLGTRTISTTPGGYAALLGWARRFGTVDRIGVEGTGSYGAGLARWLRAHGQLVIEVDRPDRAARRRQGKADGLDAHAAARAVQAGTATGQPKAGDGTVEMIRSLRLARRSAVKARTQAANQLKALLVTAPDGLRAQLRHLSPAELVTTAARLRAATKPATPTEAAKLALRSIARRWLLLTQEITALDTQLDRLVAMAALALVAVKGVGTETAAVLLVAAGDNPERLRSEAAFAHLCGVAPIPASSGKTTRHRLNRGGNREARNRSSSSRSTRRPRPGSWPSRSATYQGLPSVAPCLIAPVACHRWPRVELPDTWKLGSGSAGGRHRHHPFPLPAAVIASSAPAAPADAWRSSALCAP
jgi:transposase